MAENGHKLRKLEEAHGDLNKVIPPLVNQLGQSEAGRKLGISQYTVCRWLKENGYKPIITYVRENQSLGVVTP